MSSPQHKQNFKITTADNLVQMNNCTNFEQTNRYLWPIMDNQIQTATDFFTFVKNKFKQIEVEFVSSEFIEELEMNVLVDWFKNAKTIPGTLGYHSFNSIPGNNVQGKLKKYSLSTTEKTVSVIKGRRRAVGGGRGEERIRVPWRKGLRSRQ